MGTVTVMPTTGADSVTLGQATDRFLRRDAFEPSTRQAYRRTLQILLDEFDADRPVTAITRDDLDDLLTGRWGKAAATTFNRHRAALLSFFGWVHQRGWTPANPAAGTEARKVRRRTEDERRDRPLTLVMLEQLWRLPGIPGRDRLLWRMAYETWARAEELLGLNLEDLDVGLREGIVTGKGGDRQAVFWATGTARLLPRIIGTRTTGPLFLAAKRPTRPMPVTDLDPDTGRARLSYRQAARLFAAAGTRIDPTGPPWTLHRLRHAGITHAVEAGWSLAQVRAKSRHASLRSLEVYTNPPAASIAAMTAALDPEARRKSRV